MAWVRARLCKLQKGCTRLAAANNKVYQLLVHGRWFSPGIAASSHWATRALQLPNSLSHPGPYDEYAFVPIEILVARKAV
jgi:hypothetical protein